VKITGAASGGGKYVGRIIGGRSTAVTSGNLAMPEGMTEPPSDQTCLILNAWEDGSGVHLLRNGTCHVGRIVGMTEGGLPIVAIDREPDTIAFKVKVTRDGGQAGDINQTCSFTYAVTNERDEVLSTGLTPDVGRIPNCEYFEPEAGSPGLGYYDAGGFHLHSVAQERPTGDIVTLPVSAEWDATAHGIRLKTRKMNVLEVDPNFDADWFIQFRDCQGNT